MPCAFFFFCIIIFIYYFYALQLVIGSLLISCKSVSLVFIVQCRLKLRVSLSKPHELLLTSFHFPAQNLWLSNKTAEKVCVHIFLNEMSFADLNECGLKPRPCEHRCMNTHGSYKCYCLNGYMLMPDGSCSSKLYKLFIHLIFISLYPLQLVCV